MPSPPLPDVPCVRVRLIYEEDVANSIGNRFYLSYSGSAPTPGNCVTLATDISGAWGTHLAPLFWVDTDLTEVDVLDIATDSGSSGQYIATVNGTRTGNGLPQSGSANIEYNIARR